MSEYNELSENDLQSLIQGAEKALKEKQKKKRKDIFLQIKQLADSIGVTVTITENNAPKKIKKVAAKYINPQDVNQTWSGRGIAPKWMQTLVEAGHDKSEFLIQK